MMRAILTKIARWLCASMLQTDSLVGVSGTLNLEWNVLPKSRRLEAIPVVPVPSATVPPVFPSIRQNAAKIVLRTYVFKVPPLASMKKAKVSCFKT